MRNIAISFGIIILSLLVLMKVTEYSYISGALSFNNLIFIFAILFFVLGIFLSKKYFQKSPLIKSEESTIDKQKIKALRISNREYEVLELIAKGHSNLEIADILFVSENTIKTHISNLLLKLNAKRRTQAVKIAFEKGIL